jgi:phosphoglycerate dehydrogenase-like enzyme
MIGKNELGRMKRSAFLVNTSRGSVIDQDALYTALCDRLISGAALDVFEEEPPPQDSPLLKLGNVVLTPHTAGTTEESVKRTAETAAKDIVRLFSGERPVHEYRKESLPYPV